MPEKTLIRYYKPMNQTFNIRGFVSSIDIQPDEFLLPLQEVVVNAIQSIEDLENPKDGTITIKVVRGKQLALEGEMEEPYKPIEGFEIIDTGVGFVEERFQAFNDAFTDINIGKGCKGIGRYTVLACFGSMEINSTFIDNNDYITRSFKFDTIKGVHLEGENGLSNANNKELKTIVKLNNFKKNFQKYINENKVSLHEIAEGIIQHCLLYFISNDIPQIRIYNENEPEGSFYINDLYKEVIKFDNSVKSFQLKGIQTPLNLNYIRNYKNKTHSFHLCANKREVGKKISISDYIPSFAQGLQDDEDGKYYLSVYVTGAFLDEKANNQRNKFTIPIKKEEKTTFDEISIDELLFEVSENVRKQYSNWITAADIEKNERISNYILNPKKPRLQYRHLLSVSNIFEDIPGNATDERLESELHKKVYLLEQKRSKAFERAFAKKKYDKDEFSEIIHSVLKEEAAFSAGKLADLMIRRKAIIKLFRKYLNWSEDENYMREEDIHNIIFTMGAETDTMPRDYHNLWLLDERLTFHSYSTSDRQLRTNKHIKSDSQKETDLLIYDFPWAYADNQNKINSLVVFEFKRPGRDMNSIKDKKLDSQVAGYFEKLLGSKSKNDKGKLLNIERTTPKFGYIICDLDKDLKKYNIDYNFFKETPYGTLYKINEPMNQYFEVMSYDTMLDFAEKRHDAFFQALGIDAL